MGYSVPRSLAISCCVLLGNLAQAQLVYITQQPMRDWLNDYVPGCVDASGYLNTQDPGLADVYGMNFDLGGGLTMIEGLAYFPNVYSINMESTGPCVPYTVDGWPPNVTRMNISECAGQQLPSWPPLVDTLVVRNISGQFDLPDFPPNLLYLEMWGCPDLLSFPLMPQGMRSMWVEDADLVTDVSPLPSTLESIELSGLSSLTTLGPWPTSLEWLRLSGCGAVTSLEPFPPSLRILMLGGLSPAMDPLVLPETITDLYLGEELWTSITAWPDSMGELWLGQDWWAEAQAGLPYPGLCIPPLPDNMGYFMMTIEPGAYGLPVCLPNYPPGMVGAGYEFQLTSCVWPEVPIYSCATPDLQCLSSSALLKGVTFDDANGDGIMNGGESLLPGAGISIEPGGLLTSSDQAGLYTAMPGVGSYTVTGVPTTYWTVTTPAQSSDLLALGAIDSLDAIGSIAIPGMYDLRADISCTGSHPGFGTQCWCKVINVGTEPQTGVVTITLDSDQSTTGFSPTPDNTGVNTATWNVPVIQPGETWTATIGLYTAPGVPLGTAIEHTASVSAQFTDQTPANNTYTMSTIVVGSYDPNDKQVRPSQLSLADVSLGTPVEYTIRFQNTGTAPAQNVVINDTLSSDLIWSSFQLLASSHPHTWLIQDGVLYFSFNNIQLPDSGSNEPDSHGFVKFTMMPASDLLAGEVVGNTANIYFDYNEPIITNEAIFGVETSTGIAEGAQARLHAWPSPTSDVLYISGVPAGTLLEVVDVTGRAVVRMRTEGDRPAIDVRELNAGIYTLRSLNDGPNATTMFVKR